MLRDATCVTLLRDRYMSTVTHVAFLRDSCICNIDMNGYTATLLMDANTCVALLTNGYIVTLLMDGNMFGIAEGQTHV